MTDTIHQNVGVFPKGLATPPPSARHRYIATVYPKRSVLSHHLYPIYLLVLLASIASPSMCYTIANGANSEKTADLSSPTATSEYVSSLQTTTDISLSKSTTKRSGLTNPISVTSATGSIFSKSSTQLADTSARLREKREDVILSGTSVSKESNPALNSGEYFVKILTPGSDRGHTMAAQQTHLDTNVASIFPRVYQSYTSKESIIPTSDTETADEDGSGFLSRINNISTDPTPSSPSTNSSNNDTIYNPSSLLIPVSTSQSKIEHNESLMGQSTSTISNTTKAPHTQPSMTGIRNITLHYATKAANPKGKRRETHFMMKNDLTSLNREGTPSYNFRNPTLVTLKEFLSTSETTSTSHTTPKIALEKLPQMTNSATKRSKTLPLPEESSSGEIPTFMRPSEVTELSLTELLTKKYSPANPSSVKSTNLPTMTEDDLTPIEKMAAPNTQPRGNVVSSDDSVSSRSSSVVPVSSQAPPNVDSTSPLIVPTTNINIDSTIMDISTPGHRTVLPVTSTDQHERNWSDRKGQTATTKSYFQKVETSPGKVSYIKQTVLPRSDPMPSEPSEDLSPRVSITVLPKSTSPSTTKILEIATKSPGTIVVSKHLDNMNNATSQSAKHSQESVTIDKLTFTSPSEVLQETTASLTDTEGNVDNYEISSPVTTSSTPQTKDSQSFTQAIMNPASSTWDNVKSFKSNVSISPTSTPTHKTTTTFRTTVDMVSSGLSPEASSPATTESPRNVRKTQAISDTPTIGTLPDTSITLTSTNENVQETLAKSTVGISFTKVPYTSATALYTATTNEFMKTSIPDPSSERKSSTEQVRNATTLIPDSSTVSHEKRQTTTKSEPSTENIISTGTPFKQYTGYQTTGGTVEISERTNDPLEKLPSTFTTEQPTDGLISSTAPFKQYTGYQTAGEAVEISAKPDQSTAGVISLEATVLQTKVPEDKTRTIHGTGNTLVHVTVDPATKTTGTSTKSSETISFGGSSTVPLRSSTYDPGVSLSYSSPTTDKPAVSPEQTTANSYTPASSVGFTDVTSDVSTPSLTNLATYSTAPPTTSLTPSVLSTTFAEAVAEASKTTTPPQTHTERQTNAVIITSTLSQWTEQTHTVTTATSPSQTSTVISTTEDVLETLEAETALPEILTPTTQEQKSSQAQTTGLRHIQTSITTRTTKETEPMTEKVTLSTQVSSSTHASSSSTRLTSLKTSGSTSTTSSSRHVQTSLLPTSLDSSIEQQVKECEQFGNDCDQLTENCVNTYGKYQCECKRGYYKNQDSVCLVGVSFYGRLRIDSVIIGGSTAKPVHYTPELQDPKSSLYRELAEKVQNMVDSVFLTHTTSMSTYKGCKMIQFLSGSIVAEFQLTVAGVSTPQNESGLQLILRNAVDNGTVKDISGFLISSKSVLVTPLDECTREVHDCSMFATCLDQPIGFNCSCNPGFQDLHYDVKPGRYCQPVDRLPKPQMHVIVAIVLTTSIVVLVTVTALLAFVHRKCYTRRTSSSIVKIPPVTAPRKISDAFLAGDVEAGVWCPAPGEEADAWSSGSSSSTCPDTGKTNAKNVHMAPIACIPECEFEIGHDVIGEMNEKKQTVCSKSTSKQASDQHKPLNSMMGSVAPSSGQGEGPGRQSAVIQW